MRVRVLARTNPLLFKVTIDMTHGALVLVRTLTSEAGGMAGHAVVSVGIV
jgi:hypothetical protein